MTDEKILMKKLDEMVLKGHGEELVYACSIAAGAAIGGYQASIICSISFMCANEIKEKIRKNRNSKDEIEEGS